MAESYDALVQKYRRLIDHLRQVEQERNDAISSYENLVRSNTRIEKSTRYLCETILKKIPGGKEEEAWFRMPLADMVDKAQEGIEKYFPSVQKLLTDMLAHNEERAERISELEKEVTKEKRKREDDLREVTEVANKKINLLASKLKTGRLEEDEIRHIVGDGVSLGMNSLNLSSVDSSEVDPALARHTVETNEPKQFETEPGDNLSGPIADSVAGIMGGDTVVFPKPGTGVGVHIDAATRSNVRNEIEKITEEDKTAAIEYARSMTDTQKLVVRVIGETGMSEAARITERVMEQFPGVSAESTIRAAIHDLTVGTPGEGLPPMAAVKFGVPGSQNFCIYKLTEKGTMLYRYLFGKAAVESEYDAIIRAHTSPEHGYGIKKTALLIQKLKSFQDAKVVYMTREKKYEVPLSNGGKYIPDIVVIKTIDGEERKSYIEYETGKCTEADFMAKCSKIASFQKHINIIVPDGKAKSGTQGKLEKWKEAVYSPQTDSPLKWPVTVRISTYYEVENKANQAKTKGIPWITQMAISPPYLKKKQAS